MQAADGPGAHDQDGVAERGADVLVAGLHRAQGLGKGALREAQRRRHAMDHAAGEDIGRQDRVLGQPAVVARSDTDLTLVVAEVEAAHAAVPAAQAVHVGGHGEVLADVVVTHAAAHGLDDACELVAGGDAAPGVGAFPPAAQVGAADAAGLDGEEDTVVGAGWHGNVQQLDALGAGDGGGLHDPVLTIRPA